MKLPLKLTFFSLIIFLILAGKALFVRLSILNEVDILGFAAEVSLLFLLVLLLSLAANKLPLFIANMMLSILFLSAILYFDFYHSIVTYQALAQAGQLGEVTDSVLALFKGEYLLLFSDFLLYPFFLKNKREPILLSKKATAFLLIPCVVLIGIGMTNARNTLSEINQYNQVGFLGYQLLTSAAELNSSMGADTELTPDLVAKTKPSSLTDDDATVSRATGKNLIIVQLESVQTFLISKQIDGNEVTPNLNQFLQESSYFPHFYSQVGKGNTSDAEFIVNTSIYPLGDTPMSTAIAEKDVPSLPKVLKTHGYVTATFHANDVSFWNREKLYQALGFDAYYDDRYFGSEDVISYGPSDEILYKKTIDKLREFQATGMPFYAHIIALSSHHPFKLPEEKKAYVIDLPTKFDGSIVGSYIEAVSYADYAFGKLIEELKRTGLYDDSVLVVYGDHQGLQMKTDEDRELVRELFGREYDKVLDHLNVPLLIHVPGEEGGEVVDTAAGLVDIYPTVSNLLGLDTSEEILFGTDLFNTAENLLGLRFYAPTGTYITTEYGFKPGQTKDEGEITPIDSRESKPADKQALSNQDLLLEFLQLSDQYIEGLN